MGTRAENGFDRLDRKIGSIYSRAMAIVFLIPAGLILLLSTISSDNFAFSTHWPGLAAAAILFLIARYCFARREGMLSLLSDTEKSAKR